MRAIPVVMRRPHGEERSETVRAAHGDDVIPQHVGTEEAAGGVEQAGPGR